MEDEEISDEVLAAPIIGSLFRGQAWIELHGIFTVTELRALADKIEEACKGLERKDVI